jgi:hypothetical protein
VPTVIKQAFLKITLAHIVSAAAVVIHAIAFE